MQFVIPLVLALAGSDGGAPKQEVGRPNSNSKPEVVLADFYKWYLTSLKENREPIKDVAALQKYVTDRLIRQIQKEMKSSEGLQEDYFLKSQDWLDDWVNAVSVEAQPISGTSATATVRLGSKPEHRGRLKVILRREKGAWKIDRVDDLAS